MEYGTPDGREPVAPRSGLGSLTQAARSKQLKTARGLLIFVGVWLLLSLGFEWLTLDMQLHQLAKEHGVPEGRVPELREALMPAMYVISAIYVGLAVLYFIFAGVVRSHPVPITITALVIFVALLLIAAALDPASIAKGWLVKIIVIVGLAKAIQAALAYQRELDAAPVLESADEEPPPEDQPRRRDDW